MLLPSLLREGPGVSSIITRTNHYQSIKNKNSIIFRQTPITLLPNYLLSTLFKFRIFLPIVQRLHYLRLKYPFALIISGISSSAFSHKFKNLRIDLLAFLFLSAAS